LLACICSKKWPLADPSVVRCDWRHLRISQVRKFDTFPFNARRSISIFSRHSLKIFSSHKHSRFILTYSRRICGGRGHRREDREKQRLAQHLDLDDALYSFRLRQATLPRERIALRCEVRSQEDEEVRIPKFGDNLPRPPDAAVYVCSYIDACFFSIEFQPGGGSFALSPLSHPVSLSLSLSLSSFIARTICLSLRSFCTMTSFVVDYLFASSSLLQRRHSYRRFFGRERKREGEREREREREREGERDRGVFRVSICRVNYYRGNLYRSDTQNEASAIFL